MDFASVTRTSPVEAKVALFRSRGDYLIDDEVLIQDALLDSDGTRRRLETHVAVRMLPDAGHVIRGETEAIKAVLPGGGEPAAHVS